MHNTNGVRPDSEIFWKLAKIDFRNWKILPYKWTGCLENIRV